MNERSRFTARSVSPVPKTSRRSMVLSTRTSNLNSNAAVHKTFPVRRTSAALKDTGLVNYKEPSPTSITHSFDFGGKTERPVVDSVGDEPFDCSGNTIGTRSRSRSKKQNHSHYHHERPMSTGHLGRLEGTMHAPNSGIYAPRRYSGNALLQQASLRKATPPNYRLPSGAIRPGGGLPTSPRRERDGISSAPGSPQSVTSKSRKASSFRQRRMQLAKERKWKEEQLERSVQYKTRSGSFASRSDMRLDASSINDTNKKTTIGGKELILPSHGPAGVGMEISITNHLEKEGSNTVIRRHEYILHDDEESDELPLQTARREGVATASCTTSDDEVSPADGSDTEYVDSDVESMTIDTVSSLNTFQSEDAFSIKSWRPSKVKTTESPGSKPKFRKKINNMREGKRDVVQNTAPNPNVHPPMYVSSKKVRVKRSKMDASREVDSSNDSIEEKKTDEVAALSSSPNMTINVKTPDTKRKLLDDSDIQNISDRSPFEKSINFDQTPSMRLETPSPQTKVNVLDSTTLACNKTKTLKTMKNDEENDIPRLPSVNVNKVALKSGKDSIHREIPRSHSFQSSGDDLSVKSLRRKRLQNYMSKNQQKDVPGDEAVNAPELMNEVLTKSDEIVMNEVLTESKDIPINVSSETKLSHSRNESVMSTPFDESLGLQNDDACEEKLEEDLQDLADQRDKDFCVDDAIDNKSVRSIRSSRSFYSLQSLRTCYTCEPVPASKEERKKSLNRKKKRLQRIHHALTCTHPHPTRLDDPNYTPCPEVKHCHALSVLVAHVQTCTFTENGNGAVCEVPGCHEYKKLWNHYRRCVLRTFTKPDNKKCKICSDVWRKYTFDLEQSFESVASRDRDEEKIPN